MNNKRNKEEILFKTVKEDNILPITSICKLNCIFCSHKNNPPEIETYSYGHLEFDLIKTMIEFLDPERPVFIGESASKIIEGEPFVHPEIFKILKYLRQRWPEIEIKITSSGSFLELDRLELIEQIKPLELNISLNAPAPEERVFLMNDSRPNNVFKLISELKKHRIKFEASIVSMHHLNGFKYLKKTFDFLENYPPQSLRVFMAGFSHYADPEIKAEVNEYFRLNNFISNIKNNYSYPIIIEPQIISSLEAKINAVLADSPAAEAGLKNNDIILRVDQKKVESRVDAFYKIKTAQNPVVDYSRNQKQMTTTINKEKKESSGLIISYDLSLKEKHKLEAFARDSSIEEKNIATAVLSSELAYPFLKDLLLPYLNSDSNLQLLKVKNNFFGGSIIAAGLLTNQDLIKTLKRINKKIDRIILPGIIYDYYGNDLLGQHYSQLEDEFKAEVILI